MHTALEAVQHLELYMVQAVAVADVISLMKKAQLML
jgi:hypothetical protein